MNVSNCEQCAEKKEKKSNDLELVTQLSNLEPNEEGNVAFIKNDQKACQRLLDMGLTCSTHIRVVNAAPFHDPLELEVRGTNLAIDRGLAGKVFIKVGEPRRSETRQTA